MNNTLKKITPFLILSISAIIYSIVIVIKEKELGWGIFAVVTLIVIGIILFIIDFGLKKWLKNYKKIFLTEFALLVLVIIFYSYKFNRTKTLIIPTEFNKSYVTIIYGVENSKDLSISALTWNKSIEIPKNGILLTSSDFNENLRETEIKMNSGIYLGSDETEKGFVRMTESEFQSNGRNYKFRTWKIQDGFCCMYTSEEVEKYKAELKTEFEKIKASR
jgi:energy-coupling factor transporter transmembrane protein EcfT